MTKWLNLYKKSLKPLEIEELADVSFFRIFGFLIALSLRKTKLSPNYLTLISMIFGLAAGTLFIQADYNGLLYGTIALILANIFDCSDGQLARLTNTSSKFGKTLDGLADYVTYVSIYTGISYHLFFNNYSVWVCVYGIISMMIMFIHIIYFDHFKNEYISYVLYDRYKERAEDLKELKKKYMLLRQTKDINWLLAFALFAFYRWEYFLVSPAYTKNYKGYISNYGTKRKPPSKISMLYQKNLKPVVRLWSFFGASSHLMLFIIFSILNQPILIFHFISILYNIAFVYIVIYQKKRFSLLFG